MVNILRQDLEAMRGGPYMSGLQRVSELDYLPPARLQQLHGQMRRDLDALEKVFIVLEDIYWLMIINSN